MQQNTEAQMSDVLEWREHLATAHRQMQEAMTELITQKNYAAAEHILRAVDQLIAIGYRQARAIEEWRGQYPLV
jgi:hypothetical protein